jgi:predicted outer membrane repeat protein
MSTRSFRTRAALGGLLSLAVMAAPLALITTSVPAGADSSNTVRPFLSASPRTFPVAQMTLNVNTVNDTDATNPGSGACADVGGMCSIRAALEVANAVNQTVNINIPAGSYQLTIGNLDLTDPAGVQLIGAGAVSTNITAKAGSDSLTVDSAAGSSLGGFGEITNLTLNGGTGLNVGSSNGTLVMTGSGINGANDGSGAGLYNNGQVWATNSTFTNNVSNSSGGAIYNNDGSIRLNGDTFSGTTAVTNGGRHPQWGRSGRDRQLELHLEFGQQPHGICDWRRHLRR